MLGDSGQRPDTHPYEEPLSAGSFFLVAIVGVSYADLVEDATSYLAYVGSFVRSVALEEYGYHTSLELGEDSSEVPSTFRQTLTVFWPEAQ
jgi:hypothetical protein